MQQQPKVMAVRWASRAAFHAKPVTTPHDVERQTVPHTMTPNCDIQPVTIAFFDRKARFMSLAVSAAPMPSTEHNKKYGWLVSTNSHQQYNL